eukprot:4886484-Lingulodinium_polyedra.AAC.1
MTTSLGCTRCAAPIKSLAASLGPRVQRGAGPGTSRCPMGPGLCGPGRPRLNRCRTVRLGRLCRSRSPTL